MADPPDPDDPLVRILQDEDSFRVAIRGFTFLEDMVDGGINDALIGGAPREIRRLSADRKLALAAALGIIDQDLRRLISELSRVRNGFAHGSIEDLEPERARELIEPVHAIFRDPEGNLPTLDLLADLQGETPARLLKLALMVASANLSALIVRAEREREEREEALQQRRMQETLRTVILERLRRSKEERAAGED